MKILGIQNYQNYIEKEQRGNLTFLGFFCFFFLNPSQFQNLLQSYIIKDSVRLA